MSIFRKFTGFLTKHSNELRTIANGLELLLRHLPVPKNEKQNVLEAIVKLKESSDNITKSIPAIQKSSDESIKNIVNELVNIAVEKAINGKVK